MRLAAATVVPLGLVFALEIGLRVFGYGYPTGYFLPSRVEGTDYLIPNERFSYRFFPSRLARDPMLLRMPVRKPAGTRRIFLFGESAAYGDPDPAFGVGRYLEVLLEERHPSTDVEVICVAMTAINSHVILPIARECARHDGDLWVVYMGNNEMVGPYGAGTVFGGRAPPLAAVRAVVALKTTRVGQLLSSVLAGIRSGPSDPRDWTGINMFTRNPLHPDDPGRLRAYANFKANLNAILEQGKAAGVPIVLSTVASNLKDCSPFISLHRPGLEETDLTEWDRLVQEGNTLEGQGAYSAALTVYSNAIGIDPDFAELHYRMGTCQLALSNHVSAGESFRRARDLDALVVRADTRINQILKQAGQRGGPQVVGVDCASAFGDGSSERIAGRELFYEHVHLTVLGNYRLARLLAEAAEPLLFESASRTNAWAESEMCDRRLALTVWDQKRLWGLMRDRCRTAPFTSQSSHPANVAYVHSRLNEITAAIDAGTPAVDRGLFADALARAPDDPLLLGHLAMFLEATGSRPQAIEQARKICALLPDLSWSHYYLGALLLAEGETSEAAQSFERALTIRKDFSQARAALNRIRLSSPRATGEGP